MGVDRNCTEPRHKSYLPAPLDEHTVSHGCQADHIHERRVHLYAKEKLRDGVSGERRRKREHEAAGKDRLTHRRACILSGTKMKFAVHIAQLISGRPHRTEEGYFLLIVVV